VVRTRAPDGVRGGSEVGEGCGHGYIRRTSAVRRRGGVTRAALRRRRGRGERGTTTRAFARTDPMVVCFFFFCSNSVWCVLHTSVLLSTLDYRVCRRSDEDSIVSSHGLGGTMRGCV